MRMYALTVIASLPILRFRGPENWTGDGRMVAKLPSPRAGRLRHIGRDAPTIQGPEHFVSVTATATRASRRIAFAVTSTIPDETAPPTANRKLVDWVEQWTAVLQPSRVHWCDGSSAEYETLCRDLVESGTFASLDATKRPNSFYAR